ncbi:putative pentatricopeptide repeat-containing protein, partial [Mucuna pruriens]
MNRALLPKHVAAVVKTQKDPLKALEMFNSAKNEEGFKHTVLTYKCIVQKLGLHGEFEEMEKLLSEMRENVSNELLEGAYIEAMKNYGRKGKVQEAVDTFERMDFYNCDPSVHSFNAIMNILVEYGYHAQAHKVYMRMRDKGVQSDVYTYTIRIKSFCRTSRPHAALRLLRNMPELGCDSNAVAYCTVVAGLFHSGHCDHARLLFDEMLARCLCPDVVAFNKLVHVLCKKGLVSESEKLLNKVLKRGVCPNLFTFNIFVQGLCREGALDRAVRLLGSVSREGLSLDVVTYNILICGLCRNSRVVEAEEYLQKMVNYGFEPDGFTYNIIIDGYCKKGMVQCANRVLKDAVFKGFKSDEFTYCSLINGFCQDGDPNQAMAVFRDGLGKGLRPSIVVYNTLIKGLSQQGLILPALQLMNEMAENGYQPNIWTYNLVINGLCKMGCVSDASHLVDDAIAKGCLPDIFTYNTLIDGYCKQLKLDNAIEIVNRMWSQGMIPDVITYNTLLNGLCKVAKSEEVMEIFKAMEEKGCCPNIITYNIIVESLCKAKKVNEAVGLLGEMKSKGLIPDVVSFGTLITGFYKIGDLDGAYQLFRRMEKQYDVFHTTATYNIIISAFSEQLKMNMAMKLFDEMKDNGCVPDNYTYRVVIDGFCKLGNVTQGYNFLLKNIEKGLIPSLTTFGRVLNCLCVKHQVHEAVGIIHLMLQKGIVPETVNTIFEADKKVVAAPKIVVEDLLKKGHITYQAYELLYDGIRDKKILKKRLQTVNSLRRGASSLKATKQIHSQICKTGLDTDPIVLGKLLLHCAITISDSLHYALRLFHHFPNPDTFMHNTLIRALSLSQTPLLSLHPFIQLRRQPTLFPDSFSFVFALKGVANSRHLRPGIQLHSQAFCHGFDAHIFVGTTLISMYAECGDSHSATRVFDEMSQPNVVAWNAAVTAAFRYGHVEGARDVFGRMPVRNLTSWNVMLSGYAKAGELGLARRVFCEMPLRDDVSWSTMIVGFAHNGCFDEAFGFFRELLRQGIGTNEVSLTGVLSACAQAGAFEFGNILHGFMEKAGLLYVGSVNNALIDTYSRCGNVAMARLVFQNMPVAARSIVSWTSIIAGLAMHGYGEEAIQFFHDMEECGVRPDGITFISILYACSHSGLVEEGGAFFSKMKNLYGIEPAIEHYGCMVDLYGRAARLQKAYEFICEMPVSPNAIIWRTLLGACSIHGNIELAELVKTRLAEMDPDNSGDHVLLSNVYAIAGKWKDVASIRRTMTQQSMKKSPGWSMIEIDKVIYRFVAGEKPNKVTEEAHEKLGEIMLRLRAEAGYAPQLRSVLHDIEEEEKEDSVSKHSEKLAAAFGIAKLPNGRILRIVKNLRVCGDCHTVMKLISRVYQVEIIVRDRSRFHSFKDGFCSCRDYW